MTYAPTMNDYRWADRSQSTRTATQELRKLLSTLLNFPSTAPIVNEIPISSSIQKIRQLQSWGTNWDGAEVIAVSTKAAACTTALIDQIYSIGNELDLDWIAPNVTASPHGEVVLEWWNREKKLTIYVNENRSDYVLAWGLDVDSEMKDGILSATEIAPIFEWLGE
jgi:hypothetical protein